MSKHINQDTPICAVETNNPKISVALHSLFVAHMKLDRWPLMKLLFILCLGIPACFNHTEVPIKISFYNSHDQEREHGNHMLTHKHFHLEEHTESSVNILFIKANHMPNVKEMEKRDPPVNPMKEEKDWCMGNQVNELV